MTPAERERILALAEKWESRASSLHIKPYDDYTPGMVATYDFAADELRALVAEMGDDDG